MLSAIWAQHMHTCDCLCPQLRPPQDADHDPLIFSAVNCRMLKMMGMEPGGEFKVALEEADACGARWVINSEGILLWLARLQLLPACLTP